MRLLPVLALAAACSEQEFTIQPTPQPAGDLAIRGRVCDDVRKVWLANALVYTHLYDEHDVVYASASDYSDLDGRFELTNLVADKDYEIYTQVGHDIVNKQIVHLEGQDVELPAPICAGTVQLEVAVVTGAYDDLAPMLDTIGLSGAKVIDGRVSTEITDFLSDATAMAEYDVIFFDGGHKEEGVVHGAGAAQTVRENLVRYVDAGGVVFASDWAYDVVEQTWPDRVDFYGDDLVPDAAQVGEAGEISADVVDGALSDAIGLSTVDVTYDLAVWPLIDTVDPTVEVLLRGDAPWREGLAGGVLPDSPLLVTFTEGEGQVMFTTYRNTANVANDAMLEVLITLVNAIGDR